MQGSNPTSSLKTSHISYWHNLRSHKKWERFTRADLVGRFSAEACLELRPEDGLSDFRKPLGVGDQVPENAAGKNDRFRIRWHFWAGGGKKVVFEEQLLLIREAWNRFFSSSSRGWLQMFSLTSVISFFSIDRRKQIFFCPDVLIRFSDTCAMTFSVAPSDADARHFFA